MNTQILFNAQDHSYNGKKITYTSVSKLISKYKKPYNRDYWSKYKAYEKILGQKEFKAIRKQLGHPLEDDSLFNDLNIMVSQEDLDIAIKEVLGEWKSKNDKSIIKGNNYHEFKENQAKELGYCENPFTGIKCPTIHSTKIEYKKGIEYRSPVVTNLYDLEDGFHPELILWNDKVKIAGQSDLVFIETVGKKRFIDLSDYKTNGKIDTYNFMKHRMLDPLSHLMDCVSGDTKLITDTGIIKIKDAVNIPINIWNGSKWSEVIPFETKKNTDLYRVLFDDGSYLDVTDNHKFLIKYRLDKDFEEQTTLDIMNKISKTKWLPRIPNSNIIYDNGICEEYAYDYGFILGDGTVTNNYIYADLYNDDKKINFYSNPKILQSKICRATFKLNLEFTRNLKYEYGLPDVIFSWNRESILKFLSGWIDADGANQYSSIRLYGKEDKLRDAQLLFTKCGIKSSIKLVQEKGTKTNLCVRQNDLYYLHISKTSDLFTQRVISNNYRESTKKHKWQFIKSITKLEVKQDSYCLTEKENGTCVFNNALTKQCNYNHYRLQLSCYAWLLEQAGFIPRNLEFRHLTTPYQFEYMKKEVESIMPEAYDF